MSMPANQAAPPPSNVRDAVALAVPGILAFTVPLIGFLASLLLPVVTARSGSRLWPYTSSTMRHLCAALAVLGLWVAPLLAVVSSGQLGLEATAWLMLPLCAPAGSALVVPALVAVGTYLIGTTVSVLARRPWAWVVGAWAAPLAYSAASHWLVDFTCIA